MNMKWNKKDVSKVMLTTIFQDFDQVSRFLTNSFVKAMDNLKNT